MPVIRSLFALLLAVGVSAGCEQTPISPGPQGPTLLCPVDLTVTSHTGTAVAVSYPTPVASSANPPATVSCSPAPDSEFPIGTTTVACSAMDSVGQATCSFRVEVTRPTSRLRFTRFVAFGDSITMGFLRDPTEHTVEAQPLFVSPVENYPYLLEQMLRERYGNSEIVVLNRGVGGETLLEGQERIESVLSADNPEVILILEGYNDVHSIPTSDARSALRAIARTSQVAGVEVVLATLFQVSDDREDSRPGSQDAIASLNVQIRRLASTLGLGGVADLEAAFGRNSTLLGTDGLHPNPAGYQRIAEVMRDEIVRRFEEVPAAEPVPPAPARIRRTASGRQSFSRKSGH